MRLVALKPIRMKTSKGFVDIEEGQTFNPVNVEPLIEAGVAAPFAEPFNPNDPELIGILKMPMSQFKKGGYLVRIKSKVLGEEIYLASTEKEATIGRAEGLVVYLADELINLIRSKATPAEVRAVHMVKSSLGGTLLQKE